METSRLRHPGASWARSKPSTALSCSAGRRRIWSLRPRATAPSVPANIFERVELKLRLALFPKRHHAFHEIADTARLRLKIGFQRKLLFERIVQTCPTRAPRQRQRSCGTRTQLTGQRASRIEQLVVVMDLVHQSPLQRLLRGQAFCQQNQLFRARKSGEPRQQPRSTSIRHQSDARKSELEKR